MRAFCCSTLLVAAVIVVGLGAAQAGAQPPPVPPPGVPPAGAPQLPPQGQAPAPPAADAGAAAAQVAPVTLTIAGASGVVFHPILPAAAADFELVMSKFFDAVAAVGDDAQKTVVAGWTVARAAEGAPGGVNALYLFLIDPVVPGADYSGTFILEMVYKAFPTEAPDLHRKFTAAYAGPRHVLTLTPVFPPPVALPAPAPVPR